MPASAPHLQRLLICTLLVLPWLNPFAPGPMAAIVPWLVACGAVAGVLGVQAFVPSQRHADARIWPHAAAWAWLIAGGLSSLMGLIQYFGQSAPLFPWVNTTPFGEAFANLRQRNQFASLTHIAFAALLWWAVQPRPAEARSIVRKLSVALAVLLAVGNAVSSSRTGLLQTLLVVALVACWGGLRQAETRRVVLAWVLAYALAVLVLPFVEEGGSGAWARLQAGDAVCASRMTLWRNVLTLIAQRPWFGWGWGELDYAHYITLYDGPRFCDILDNAHNLPLHLAVELGVPLALAACGLFVVWVMRAKPWRETDATRQMAWLVLAVLGLHSLLEYPLWYGPFQIAVGLCVIFLWRSKPGSPGKNGTPARAAYAVVAALLGAAVLYTAWDYYRISQIYLAPEARDPAYQTDTLDKIRATHLFQSQVRFAELSITPLTMANAPLQLEMAQDLLHFSPEHRVVERLIDSALLLGRDDLAAFHMRRFKAAFPQAYADWLADHRVPPRGAPGAS